jgi:hypothetical protein
LSLFLFIKAVIRLSGQQMGRRAQQSGNLDVIGNNLLIDKGYEHENQSRKHNFILQKMAGNS